MIGRATRCGILNRLRRRLLGIFALVSLLLLIAACGMWVRSYFVTDRINWRHTRGDNLLQGGRGFAEFSGWFGDNSRQPADWYGVRYQKDLPQRPSNFMVFLNWDPGDVWINHAWGGFEWHEKRDARRPARTVLVIIPFWWLAVATALTPVAWLVSRVRSRVLSRRRAGRCRACGYDLRATPEGGGPLLERCPECGAVQRHDKMNLEHSTLNIER